MSVPADTTGRKLLTEPTFLGWAGVARREITPPSGIFSRCWGPATWDVMTAVHRPFTLTALAIRETQCSDPLILITLDAGWWWHRSDEWHVRKAVLEAIRLPASRVIVHLSHTHSGPSLSQGDAGQPGGHLIGEYLDTLREAAVSASTEASRSCVESRLTWATGRCAMAANRNMPCGDRYLVGYNPDVVADDTVLVGRLTNGEHRTVATLVNYACHPTTLAWQNRASSPDFVGAMRNTVEAATGGAPCLFLQGADGDLAPAWQYVGDTAVADAHGRQLGFAVLSTLEGLLPPGSELTHAETVESNAPLALWRPTSRAVEPHEVAAVQLDVAVDLRPMPSSEVLEQRWSHVDERMRRARLERIELLAAQYAADSDARHPLWLWRIGDCAVVAHPGEAYSAFQISLRERFRAAAVIVLNHANAPTSGPGWVYIPDAASYEHDIYQVWRTPLAQGTLERLADAASESLERDLGFQIAA